MGKEKSGPAGTDNPSAHHPDSSDSWVHFQILIQFESWPENGYENC